MELDFNRFYKCYQISSSSEFTEENCLIDSASCKGAWFFQLYFRRLSKYRNLFREASEITMQKVKIRLRILFYY